MKTIFIAPHLIEKHTAAIDIFSTIYKNAREKNDVGIIFNFLDDLIDLQPTPALKQLNREKTNGRAHLFYMMGLLNTLKRKGPRYITEGINDVIQDEQYYEAFEVMFNPNVVAHYNREQYYVYEILIERINPFIPHFLAVNHKNILEAKDKISWISSFTQHRRVDFINRYAEYVDTYPEIEITIETNESQIA